MSGVSESSAYLRAYSRRAAPAAHTFVGERASNTATQYATRPRRSMLRASGLVLALVSVGIAGPAFAQSRFSLSADAGLGVPIGLSPRYVAALRPAGADAGQPVLAHKAARPGLHLALGAVMSDLEVRASIDRSPWRASRIVCVGDGTATRLPDGRLDDGAVDYDCDVPRTVESLAGDGSSGLTLVSIDGALRFQLRDAAGNEDVRRVALRPFLLGGAGLAVGTYTDPLRGGVRRAGPRLVAGAGVELPLQRRLSMSFSVRYTPTFLVAGGATSDRAARSVEAGRGVFGTLFDTLHRVQVGGGLSLGFR